MVPPTCRKRATFNADFHPSKLISPYEDVDESLVLVEGWRVPRRPGWTRCWRVGGLNK